MAQIFNILITFILGAYALTSLAYLGIYLRLKKKYGKQNAKRMFIKKLRIPFLIPKANSKKYKNLDSLLLSAAVDMRLETFYVVMYTLSILVISISMLINTTNDNIRISQVLQNMNLSRNLHEYIDFDDSIINREIELVSEVREYIGNAGISLADNYRQALDWLEGRITESGMSVASETSRETAERILQKAVYIEGLQQNAMPYIYAFVLAVIAFIIPDVLIVVKQTLVERNKDWEILNCMLVYSTISSLPACRVETVVSCMQEVSRIYRVVFERFKSALDQNNVKETDEIITGVKEDSIQEILETLVIASDIGVCETTENMDDMLNNKIKWLEVYAIRNRQTKFAIAIVPLVFVLFLLFMYMMQGLNIMNYALQIEF